MRINSIDPSLNSFEGLLVSQAESNQDAMRTSVEILSNSSEFLLASSIPNFNCKDVGIDFKLSVHTVNPNGLLVLLVHGLAVVH